LLSSLNPSFQVSRPLGNSQQVQSSSSSHNSSSSLSSSSHSRTLSNSSRTLVSSSQASSKASLSLKRFPSLYPLDESQSRRSSPSPRLHLHRVPWSPPLLQLPSNPSQPGPPLCLLALLPHPSLSPRVRRRRLRETSGSDLSAHHGLKAPLAPTVLQASRDSTLRLPKAL